jgi:hypothetical protein
LDPAFIDKYRWPVKPCVALAAIAGGRYAVGALGLGERPRDPVAGRIVAKDAGADRSFILSGLGWQPSKIRNDYSQGAES